MSDDTAGNGANAARGAIPPPPTAPRWLRRLLIASAALVAVVILAAGGAALWAKGRLQGSLAVLDGEVELAGLTAGVVVERDALGVPTIRGSSRLDVARATGFLHAQDRFFQMDMLRRRAGGALAELVGTPLIAVDRSVRRHDLADVARRALARAPVEHRALLEAYTEGVNQGLAALEEPPFEYLVLGVDPRPWEPADSILTLLAMYLDLQDETGGLESARGLLHDLLPVELAAFLDPRGTEWDAPIVGGPLPAVPLPGPEVFDARRVASRGSAEAREGGELFLRGSNNWAVAASHSSGGALLANDMHLGLRVPNTWYRMSLVLPAREGTGEVIITGVALPGTPAIVAGSNGRIAWGFTNSQADWSDLVVLDIDPDDAERYLTPDGPEAFETRTASIVVRSGDAETLEVRLTRWGPVVDEDHLGRPRALRWVAHEPDAVNLGMLGLETAGTVEEAMAVAHRSGVPGQNFLVADRDGRIAWTLMGLLPRRVGFDGRLPGSWADGTRRWDGWVEPDDYPRVVDPPWGRLWTANNRVVGGDDLAVLGDGGFVNGARAAQIRDDLFEIEEATPADMLAVQLDDRAVFLERWRELMLEVLGNDDPGGVTARGELARIVREGWTGRASVGSAAYRMVNAYREYVGESVLGGLTAACREADDRFSWSWHLRQGEAPLWRLVNERPEHLLPADHETWDDLMLAAADRLIATFTEDGHELTEQTWGRRNLLRMRHPLSQAIPLVGRLLDMPAEELPGHTRMPRVQGSSGGASERFVVSPGREDEGIFHMPGGQSGHPLSPFYRAGHEAWARGEPTPFLPGPTEHTLILLPEGLP